MFGAFGKKIKEMIPQKKAKPIVDQSGKTNLSAHNAAKDLERLRKKKKKMLDDAGKV